MKIKYEFVNETIEVEVDEKWARVVIELDRIESNNEKKETRRHFSLDVCEDNCEWFISDEDSEEAIIEMINYANDINRMMSILNDNQKNLIRALFVKGLSQEEYAEQIGADRTAVTHQLKTIRKKLKKLF